MYRSVAGQGANLTSRSRRRVGRVTAPACATAASSPPAAQRQVFLVRGCGQGKAERSLGRLHGVSLD